VNLFADVEAFQALRLFEPPELTFADGEFRKSCMTCKETLPLRAFRNESFTGYGTARCKSCLKQHDRIVREHEYAELIERFGSACNICGADRCEPNRSIRMCVDVDHQRGVVRGLLCKTCNVGIGMLKDDPVIVAKVMTYLLERS